MEGLESLSSVVGRLENVAQARSRGTGVGKRRTWMTSPLLEEDELANQRAGIEELISICTYCFIRYIVVARKKYSIIVSYLCS